MVAIVTASCAVSDREYGTERFLWTIKFSLYHKSQFYTGWSRLISTVGSVPPTGQHGRYRRSVRLHLRRITVDIDGRFGSKYQKLDDIDDVISTISVGSSFLAAALTRVMRAAVPIPAVASASVLQSATVGGSVVGVVGPL